MICDLYIMPKNTIYARLLLIIFVHYFLTALYYYSTIWHEKNGRCDWLFLSVVLKNKRALQKPILYLTEGKKFLCQSRINNALRSAAPILAMKYFLNVSFKKQIKPLDFINEETESERLNHLPRAAQLVCKRQCFIINYEHFITTWVTSNQFVTHWQAPLSSLVQWVQSTNMTIRKINNLMHG